MVKKSSRYVFLKQKHIFYGKLEVTEHFSANKHVFSEQNVFPDACLGFRFAILPPAGQRSRTKHVLWIPFWNLASGGSELWHELCA